MRIITGKYKGRHFDIPRSFKARPTTDFAKENIFNVLTRYIDLSLELVSRGCEHVVSVEMDRDHHRFIQECFRKLLGDHGDHGDRSMIARNERITRPVPVIAAPMIAIRGDVFRYIKSCKQQFDFIFADPPYALKELPTIPGLIFEKGLLKDDGILVFEHGKDNDFSSDPHFVEHRTYGSVNFSIFRKEATASL